VSGGKRRPLLPNRMTTRSRPRPTRLPRLDCWNGIPGCSPASLTRGLVASARTLFSPETASTRASALPWRRASWRGPKRTRIEAGRGSAEKDGVGMDRHRRIGAVAIMLLVAAVAGCGPLEFAGRADETAPRRSRRPWTGSSSTRLRDWAWYVCGSPGDFCTGHGDDGRAYGPTAAAHA